MEQRVELTSLLSLVRTKEDDQPNPVTGKYSISSKRISSILGNLKLYREPKRDGEKGGYRFSVNLRQVREVIKRLAVSGDSVNYTTTTEHTEGSEGTELAREGVVNPSEVQAKPDTPSLQTSVGSGSSETSVAAKTPERSSVATSESSVCRYCETEYGQKALLEHNNTASRYAVKIFKESKHLDSGEFRSKMGEMGFSKKHADAVLNSMYRSGMIMEYEPGRYKWV